MSGHYIFIVGGVISGVGKGIIASSIGKLLQARGFSVTALKIDPYINVDAGTMNPIEHGEVFVTHDGDECDQDIGNYERFFDTNIFRDNYMTTGRIYQSVISKERNLEYNGRCVQVVPDIPNEVINRILKAKQKAKADITLIEVGGTVGEYENILFLEAIRIMKHKNPNNVQTILVSYLPIPSHIGEMKTKPTQHANRSLNSVGIKADFIIGRSQKALDISRKRKLAIFCDMQEEDIISAPDVASIYEIPLNLEKEKLADKIITKFNLNILQKPQKEIQKFKNWVSHSSKNTKIINIGIVGKYFNTGDFTLTDSYISVIEAIKHAAWDCNLKPELHWLDAEKLEKSPQEIKNLSKYDGIIIPGGFGNRGIEGKIKTIQYLRENKIPFLGLCYGMQLAVIEFARNVCKLKNANTTEIDLKTPHPVIHTMSTQIDTIKNKNYGGTMRLGAYTCVLKKDTISFSAYKKEIIEERHRHRYELNNEYKKQLEAKGLVMAGIHPQGDLVEIIEYKDHPFFVGTQFHPEFLSRPMHPHPLFKAFIKAAETHNKTGVL